MALPHHHHHHHHHLPTLNKAGINQYGSLEVGGIGHAEEDQPVFAHTSSSSSTSDGWLASSVRTIGLFFLLGGLAITAITMSAMTSHPTAQQQDGGAINPNDDLPREGGWTDWIPKGMGPNKGNSSSSTAGKAICRNCTVTECSTLKCTQANTTVPMDFICVSGR